MTGDAATEAELVAHARSGDTDAFAVLAVRVRPVLWRVCHHITANEQDALDAMQTALAAAWVHLGSFRGQSRFSTWIYQIAHNAALELVRRRDALPRADMPVELASSRPSPDRSVPDVEAVRWALGQLPPAFRAALVLREFGGLSYAEIAAAEGIKVATVKTRIARARQGLYELLRADFGDGGNIRGVPALPRSNTSRGRSLE